MRSSLLLMLTLVAALSLHRPAMAALATIDDFATIDAWSVNADGGALVISPGTVCTPDGKASMRLELRAGSPTWGNAVRPVQLPPDAVAFEMDVYKHEAGPPARLTVWLFEADGDGYLAYADFGGGKQLCDVEPGWHHLRVPIVALAFDPRGNKQQEPLTVSKLFIGLNSAAAKVDVANLSVDVASAVETVPDSRVEALRIEDGASGRVAILRDSFEPNPGHSVPEVLGEALKEAGWGVTFLKSGDLSDAKVLSLSNFDCLVLPYGPRCPNAAFDSIHAYLKSGGSLFSTGGYAFDEPCVSAKSGGMVPLARAFTLAHLAPGRRGLNARYGLPGDWLGLEDDRVSVFDPSYHLLDAVALRGLLPTIPGMSTPGLHGYAACAQAGRNHPIISERWRTFVPLVEAVDVHGRSRGPVGALCHNYAGPYVGSSWAFFGATNTDLFAQGSPLLRGVPDIIRTITAKTFIHSLASDLAIYKPGETAKLSCSVANLGKKPASCQVTFRVFDRAGKQVFVSKPVETALQAGETHAASAQFRLAKPTSDLYRVTAELHAQGKKLDHAETGFAVHDPKVTASGFKLSLESNFFRDADRPLLISGTNMTGEIFATQTENPLIWGRDLARMNENGLSVLRVLQLTPFVAKIVGYPVTPTELNVDCLPLKLERQLDALVQLCQKHKVVLLLTLHDFMGVLLSDEELAAQRKWARLIAGRYKGVPGLMFDLENEPGVNPWTEGADWPASVKPILDDYRRENPGLDGVHAADVVRHRLANRWVEANVAGVKEGDPHRLVTVGYLPEYASLNKLLCVGKLDFANMHSYSTVETLSTDIKLFDRRFEGKSLSLGEFGAMRDHDRRIWGEDNPGQDIARYIRIGHYVFGMGGALIANWCWKDMDSSVFPWGINYTCGGPRKDIFKAYRNQSLLFRQVRPVYKTPEIWLVVPTDAMVGKGSSAAVASLYEHVDALFRARVEFGVIDDMSIEKLPAEASLVIYAGPSRIPDNIRACLMSDARPRLRRWVTGDQSFDGFTNVALNDLPDQVRDQTYTGAPQVFASSGHAFRILEHDGAYTVVLVNPTHKAETVWLVEPQNEKCVLTLGPDGVGLVRFNSSGAIIAVEAQGRVRTDSLEINMTGHFAVSSLDGRPLSKSRELMVLPFGEGEIDLTGLKDARDLSVQTGDVTSGKWQPLGGPTSLKFAASGATAFDIRVIAPKTRLLALGKRVANELMLR